MKFTKGQIQIPGGLLGAFWGAYWGAYWGTYLGGPVFIRGYLTRASVLTEVACKKAAICHGFQRPDYRACA